MQDHEAGGRPVYDHANEDLRPSGRRRRPAVDWGVGEEIFDRMPSRRFARDSHHTIPRGGADDGRRTIVIEGAARIEDDAERAAAEEFASREEALRARQENEALWGGDEPFAEPADAPQADEPPADDSFARGEDSLARPDDSFAGRADSFARPDESYAGRDDTFARPDDSFAHPDAVVRGGVPGRRTVKIGGRPGDVRGSFDRPRRRPPRTVGERLGPRPDRVAAWAFMLGLVLILIAVVTAKADAATPAESQARAAAVTVHAPAVVEVRSFTTAR